MNKAFEKIRERLQKQEKMYQESLERQHSIDYRWIEEEGLQATEEAINIINQVKAEYNQTVTNADKIRHMTDEELAEFLLKVNTAYAEPCMISGGDCKYEDYPTHDKGCKDCFLEYLRKEVEEKDE